VTVSTDPPSSSGPSPLPSPVPEYLALSFPAPMPDRPYVILNMVTSADGKATAGKTEAPLSSPTDKLVLQSLRVHAGAVLDGAGTARSSGVNPTIRDARLRQVRESMGHTGPPLQAVLSGSANLPPDAPYLRREDFPLVIFVSETASPQRIAALSATGRNVEALPAGPAGLPELVRRLRRHYDVRLLLLEGGPALNSQFFHAGFVDEVFLTLSPHIADGRGTPTAVEGESFPPESMPALDLISVYPSPETSEVYLRWRVRR